MKATLLAGLATGLLLVAVSASAEATSVFHDATADFGVTNGNPNGVWSYGWMPTDFSTFTAYQHTYADSGSRQWYTAGMSGDRSPSIWMNTTSSTGYGVAPGQLSLHPGPAQQPSVLRWTAPFEGSYDIVGQFFGGDGGTMQVGVRQGSSWLWQGTDAGVFELHRTVTAGTSIDFVVYGGYAYGNTPLALTISSPAVVIPSLPAGNFSVDVACPATASRGPVPVTVMFTNGTQVARNIAVGALTIHAGQLALLGPRAVAFAAEVPAATIGNPPCAGCAPAVTAAVVTRDISVLLPAGARTGSFVSLALGVLGRVGTDPKRRLVGSGACTVEVVR